MRVIQHLSAWSFLSKAVKSPNFSRLQRRFIDSPLADPRLTVCSRCFVFRGGERQLGERAHAWVSTKKKKNLELHGFGPDSFGWVQIHFRKTRKLKTYPTWGGGQHPVSAIFLDSEEKFAILNLKKPKNSDSGHASDL